jgi:hypothetical protein
VRISTTDLPLKTFIYTFLQFLVLLFFQWRLSRHRWPFLTRMAGTWADENLCPLLQERKPGWMRSVRVNRFSLGPVPPRFTGIKMYGDDETSKDEIVMELQVLWTGQQDVVLVAQPVPRIKACRLWRSISILLTFFYCKNNMQKMVIHCIRCPIEGVKQFHKQTASLPSSFAKTKNS